MQIRIKNELLLINICSLILLLIIWMFPDINVLCIILGLPFLLFFPGYVLIAALFPRKDEPPMINRIMLAFLYSVAVSPLIGLFSNYMPWGITAKSISASIVVYIILVSAIAWYRRNNTPPEHRFEIPWLVPLITNKIYKPTKSRLATYILILSALASMGVLIYTVSFPQHGERFTEFYMLGLEGEADFYPEQVVVQDGQIFAVRYLKQIQDPIRAWALIYEPMVLEESSAKVTLGITNQEYENASYQIKVICSGTVINEIGPIGLAHGENWREEINFEIMEPCARTHLIKPTYLPYFPFFMRFSPFEGNTIEVESAQYLEPGDTIRIGQGAGVVKGINGNKITLEQSLRTWWPAETYVVEMKKVEFKLLCFIDSTKGAGTNEEIQSLHLWVNVDQIEE